MIPAPARHRLPDLDVSSWHVLLGLGEELPLLTLIFDKGCRVVDDAPRERHVA